MIKIGILGDIGSGKSYIAKNFGYPIFNADLEVGKLYKKNKKIFYKLKKLLPKYISHFPIEKKEITNAILANKDNLKKIIKVIHLEIRNKLNIFLKKNRNKQAVILDIPLLLENKIYKKKDILVFVQSKKHDIINRLRKRPNYNYKLLKNFKNIQLPVDYKKKNPTLLLKMTLLINQLKKE